MKTQAGDLSFHTSKWLSLKKLILLFSGEKTFIPSRCRNGGWLLRQQLERQSGIRGDRRGIKKLCVCDRKRERKEEGRERVLLYQLV